MKKSSLPTIFIIVAFIITSAVLAYGIYFSRQQIGTVYTPADLEEIANDLPDYPYDGSENPLDNAVETSSTQTEDLHESEYRLVNSTIQFENGVNLQINDYTKFSDGTRFLTPIEALEMLNREAQIEDIRYDTNENYVIDIIFAEQYST
jgi:hypothetical protein